ncbi:hypothetical protein RISK_002629 [Rhodopirellula islandica]|uniref:Uncharacterized protein n=1 Tax=Rhodopirellula islandica TaxID=595434 RepID=A0A0J1BFU6_RHOIS|nr:hypothetical protein RISK_002629 [Rhodopirellula islandica]
MAISERHESKHSAKVGRNRKDAPSLVPLFGWLVHHPRAGRAFKRT